MKYLRVKSKNLNKSFFNSELKLLKYKFIFYNLKLPNFIRSKAFEELKLNRNSNNFKGRCLLTNRSRSLYNHFKISRIKLRSMFSNSFINGIKKYNK